MGTTEREFETEHEQVLFEDYHGRTTMVDDGLYKTLTILKELGVHTQFSCQGGEFGGYICAFTETAYPVIIRVLKLHEEAALTETSHKFVEDFMEEATIDIDIRGSLRVNLRRSSELQRFAYEREARNVYGDRTIIRWPKDRGDELHSLLVEVLAHS